jgi:hypothetical protein
MKITSTIRRIILTTLALTLAAASPMAFAATPTTNSGQALEIGPPIVNLKGDPGSKVAAVISLRDVSTAKLVVSNQINDFTAAGDGGTPKLLLNETTPGPNSIVPWITPLPQFTLVPQQIQKLPLNLKIPANAAPGGYYGVIRFSGQPPGINSSGVSLSASVGVLVFLRVNGTAKESMSIQQFTTLGDNGKQNWLFEGIPVNLSVLVKNNGNLFEQPGGQAVVTDMFGKTIGAVEFNEGQNYVLPATARRFTEPLDNTIVSGKFLFGKYTAKLTVTYGDSQQAVTSTLTFWIIPYRLIAAIIIALVALGLIIRFVLQRYRENILRNTRGGSRRR